MAGDEIRHEKLPLAGRGGLLLKLPGELLERIDRRLVHPPQHLGIDVFRRDLQQPAGVMRGRFGECTPGCAGPGPCECPRPPAPASRPAAAARRRANAAAAHDRSPIAGRWSGAGSFAGGIFREPRAREQFIPYILAVGPPRSLTVPEKSGSRLMRLDFGQDRRLAAALDDAALVNRDRAERTAAETAPHDLDRILHHLERRNPPPAVARVRPPGERQAVNPVDLFLRRAATPAD